MLTIVVGLILLFLFNAHYTRKETVAGYLRPDRGMLKVNSRRSGRIHKLYVRTGEVVEKNAVLASLVSGEILHDKIITALTAQIGLLDSEAEQHNQMLEYAQQLVAQNQSMLSSTLANTKQRLLLQKEKLQLLEQQHKQYAKLHALGYMSKIELQQKQQQLITHKQGVASLQSSVLISKNEQSQLEFKKNDLPAQTRFKIRQLKNRRSELERLLEETQSAAQYELYAPAAGQIAAVEVVEGDLVAAQQVLLKILPTNSILIAELLLPTRSAGFIQSGQTTHLRFDAFPHQRFGDLPGTVFRVDTAVLSPQDASLPITVSEPVYRLQASLNSQTIQAYGTHFTLKSGMLLQADILLDRRTLIEWILDPIYSLRGRLH